MNETVVTIIILILAGCLGGFISGLLGVGGGIIFVPILDYFLTKNGVLSSDLVPYTLANSFFAVLVAGIIGSISAFQSKSINLSHLVLVGFSAILFILITSILINIGAWYSPFIFKIVFCTLLLFTLIKTLMHIEIHGSEERMSKGVSIFIGSITGIVSGLSGLGGGIVMIPLFIIFGNMQIKKASALSLAVIPVLALPNVIYYAFLQPVQSLSGSTVSGSTGYIAWLLIIPIIIGVLMTVKLGVRVAQNMSSKIIKYIFASFIIITILRVLTSLA